MKTYSYFLEIKNYTPLNQYSFFDIGKHENYFNDDLANKNNLLLSKNVYIPTLKTLLKLAKSTHSKFVISISGNMMEFFLNNSKEIIILLNQLIKTGNVEILAQTYSESVYLLHSEDLILKEIALHHTLIKDTFNYSTTVVKNSTFDFSSSLISRLHEQGYTSFYWNRQLFNFTKHFELASLHFDSTYQNYFNECLLNLESNKLLIKKYVSSILSENQNELLVINFDLFSSNSKKNQTIIENFIQTVGKLFSDSVNTTFSEIDIEKNSISLAEFIHDNKTTKFETIMPKEGIRTITEMEKTITENQPDIHRIWKKLNQVDYFFNMCSQSSSSTINPHDSYSNFMNIIADFELMIKRDSIKQELI